VIYCAMAGKPQFISVAARFLKAMAAATGASPPASTCSRAAPRRTDADVPEGSGAGRRYVFAAAR